MSDDEDYRIDDSDLADDEQLKNFLPTSFGKKSEGPDIDAQIEHTRRLAWKTNNSGKKEKGVKGKDDTKSSTSEKGDDSDSESNSDSSDDDDDDTDKFPLSHELVFKSHEKAITSLSVDAGGSRTVTGSRDCTVKLYDFASMTPTTLRAFKSIDPWQGKASASTESHPVNHVSFHPLSANVILCITAHPQAKILSRDGAVLTEFVKGDMYLRDMHNTKGHVGEISTGAWHPTDREVCVTAGADSTLRIWDVNNKRSQKEVIVFKSRAAGSAGRSRMTAVAWGAPAQGSGVGGSSVLVATALDGCLVMYSGNGPFSRPTAEIRDAHKPGTWTGGVDISADGRMVVTRGGDNLIKLWDTRKFKQPLVTVAHESTSDRFHMTSIKYGPNSTSIITGSATGDLHVLNPGNLRPEVVTPVTPGSALIVADWHPKLNQVLTGSVNGEMHVLFDPERSFRGAADIVRRAPKKRHIDDDSTLTMDQDIGISGDAIVVPGAQPRGRRTGVSASGKSYDPRRPQMPNIPLSRMLHEDPREALLKYADIAKKDPIFTGAYKNTAPVTEYAELSDDEVEQPDKKKARR
ncbi:WD repeat protein [Grosmannia clavigera kw1407]|uniref:WD repeat protein n=1 Tax=Grosmannia clavigera (strain kw1407 / UAMH 11150) TaxID=655863 RepID=F0XUC6_GROCL|nr:WD repeat protein [Grosmannia clavigera kw1407]EFW98681.1 WD repeat protein [Grosmannia clavigera kw1407]